jgi:CRISPR-associated protein Csx14
MPELRIPMDPTNPGQFFACCGLWELMEIRSGQALAHFETDPTRPRQGVFRLEGDGITKPGPAIADLRAAEIAGVAFAEKAIAPVTVRYAGSMLELNWWLDPFGQSAEPLKCWAGQQTSLSVALGLLQKLPENADCNLLKFAAMTSTRFGVDPRSAWNAADVGYSPNEHQQESSTFPAVELLAAIGLQGFRPLEIRNSERKREYRYALWHDPLPRAVAALACCEPWEGLRAHRYRFELGKRGNYKVFRYSQPEERNNGRS